MRCEGTAHRQGFEKGNALTQVLRGPMGRPLVELRVRTRARFFGLHEDGRPLQGRQAVCGDTGGRRRFAPRPPAIVTHPFGVLGAGSANNRSRETRSGCPLRGARTREREQSVARNTEWMPPSGCSDPGARTIGRTKHGVDAPFWVLGPGSLDNRSRETRSGCPLLGAPIRELGQSVALRSALPPRPKHPEGVRHNSRGSRRAQRDDDPRTTSQFARTLKGSG